jgi:hypothetical protein
MSLSHCSQFLLAVTFLASGACGSSTSDDESGGNGGSGTASNPLQRGTLTIHHGDDVYSAECSGNSILRDADGNATLVQDDGEFTAVCFEDDRLGISFSVQDFLDLDATFDLVNDERVAWYAEFPVGELDGSLSSNSAEEHRFHGSFDAAANHVVATLSGSYAATTPQSDLGTLGAPTSFELTIDFRAE